LCEELSDGSGSETWPMKIEHELKMNRTEMSVIRWMCRVKLNERKKSEELGELLGLEPVSLMIKKSRLRWFGHVERKDEYVASSVCIREVLVHHCAPYETALPQVTGGPNNEVIHFLHLVLFFCTL